MIDRIKQKIVFSCDEPGCDEFLETDAVDMELANEVRKDAEWMAYRKKRDEPWLNVCPSCQEAINNG